MVKDFIRAVAITPEVTPADPRRNAEAILSALHGAGGADLIVLPELSLTGCTCGSLFFHASLLDGAEAALAYLLRETADLGALIAAGLPVTVNRRLYSCAAVFQRGALLGVAPKSRITGDRVFCSGAGLSGSLSLCGERVPFGTDLLFDGGDGFTAAFELGEDGLAGGAPSERYAAAGALAIGVLSATAAEAGGFAADVNRVQSARLRCALICASAGAGESTSGRVYAGARMIAENGLVLAHDTDDHGVTATEIDLGLLAHERRRLSNDRELPAMRTVPIQRGGAAFALTRRYPQEPFVPAGDARAARCREVLDIQARGLRTRLDRLAGTGAVVAVSGGLDSTLALLVAHRVARQDKRLLAVTMPGPGTTERTLRNAKTLCGALNIPLRTVPIGGALAEHLRDIGHDGTPDITYQNAQARERAQVILDIANAENSVVVGSSCLSEIALGFATYGGDHIMSMYGVNAGVPKTLMRHMVREVAAGSDEGLRAVLLDILDTPVSPELLPVGADGAQQQRSEELLGDYILHDFYLYWFVKHGFSREKLLLAANRAFEGRYAPQALETALDVFLTRFTRAQYKRNCSPDGVWAGGLSLAPDDWRMPGDLLALP